MNDKKTVRNKIIMYLLAFSLLLQTVLAVFMIISEKSRAEDYGHLITRTDAEKINMSLNEIARNIQSYSDGEYAYDEREYLIKNLLECSFLMSSGGFTENTGKSFAYIKDSDIISETERKIIQSDKAGWSEPYTDEYDRYIITYSQPVMNGSEQTGTVYADISIDSLLLYTELINMTYESTSHIYDKNGNQIDETEHDDRYFFTDRLSCGLEFRYYFTEKDLYGSNYRVMIAAVITEAAFLAAAAAVWGIFRIANKKERKTGKGIKRLRILVAVPSLVIAGILVYLGVFFHVQHINIFGTRDDIKPLNTFDDTVRVVCGTDEPFSYIADDGNYAGFDIEIITEIANRIHRNISIELTNWEEAVYEIEHGRADIMMNYGEYGSSDKIILTDESSYDYISMGVTADKPELADEINEVLTELRAEKALVSMLMDKVNIRYAKNNWIFEIIRRNLILVSALLSVAVMLIIHIAVTVSGYKRRELAIVSRTDALTGISNRGGGESMITNLISTGVPGVFCLMDCDKFKSVNDNYGHETGDRVLIEVAACMKKSFRESDVVMRLGGDEFAVYMNGINSQEKAECILRKFFDNIECISIPELGDRKITVSLGAVLYDGSENTTFSDLYKKADEGTYESKKIQGSAFSFFSEADVSQS